MNLFSFVFVRHFDLACGAALLFLIGALLALPVVRCGANLLTSMPMLLFRAVRRMFGSRPGMTRLWSLIFGFNGTVMFLYMASGVHPFIPAAVSLLTGYNIAVIVIKAGETDDSGFLAGSPDSGWRPSRWVAGLCAAAVVLLELPCFWYSIAMGIRLGQEVAAGQTTYTDGMAVRLQAYLLVILPLLFVSAVCEAIAIQGSGVGDQGTGRPA